MNPLTAVGTTIKVPYRCRNPKSTQPWLEPEHDHVGTVLAPTDPRAWANTLAFPDRTPEQWEVAEKFLRSNQPKDKVPVLWDFGRIYWEPVKHFHPENWTWDGEWT